MQSERNLSRCTKWASKLTVRFSQHYCSKFIPISAFIFLQSCFLFQHGKRALKTYLSPPHVSVITENILITIIRFTATIFCLLPTALSRLIFSNWYNSDMAKLESTPLLFVIWYNSDVQKLESTPLLLDTIQM